MTHATRATPCPICKKPAPRDGNKLYPFCSERCSQVDLGRWLNEDYRIPAEPLDGVPPPPPDDET